MLRSSPVESAIRRTIQCPAKAGHSVREDHGEPRDADQNAERGAKRQQKTRVEYGGGRQRQAEDGGDGQDVDRRTTQFEQATGKKQDGGGDGTVDGRRTSCDLTVRQQRDDRDGCAEPWRDPNPTPHTEQEQCQNRDVPTGDGNDVIRPRGL